MRKRLFHTPSSRSPVRHRGSALLIVLGFLSFMVISAVSFAIYMRTERQASSNYRHAVNARHLLNLGLVRAMEEVDSELRLKSNTSLKFPDWPGRVLVSAIPASDDDVQRDSDARVLSLEALSFLPPFLVNDVRRYAYRAGRATRFTRAPSGACSAAASRAKTPAVQWSAATPMSVSMSPTCLT
ncbi:MAG: hypothetical protein ACOX7Q_11800 [Kiritimatiellia bacterium]